MFQGKRADRARRVFEVVSRRLLEPPVLERLRALSEPQRPAFFGGLPGIALANWVLSRNELIDQASRYKHAALAERHLQISVDTVGELGGDGGLSRGVAGLALAIEWTEEHDPSAEADYDINADVDYALTKDLGARDHIPADLMNGLAGRAIYARARWHRPSGQELLTTIVDRLLAMAESHGDGLAWRTVANPRDAAPDLCEQYPDGWLDLGVASGNPAILVALASHPDHPRAHAAVRAGMEWMYERCLPDGIAAFAAIDGEEPMDASGWCYGDEGVASALFAAALAIGDQRWQTRWLEVLARAARREPITRRSLTLCHGCAGIGHMFNRVYQATGQRLFADAATGWFDALLGALEAGGGGRPYPSSALLQGEAGVALALEGALGTHEPFWDRTLALSIPPRPR